MFKGIKWTPQLLEIFGLQPQILVFEEIYVAHQYISVIRADDAIAQRIGEITFSYRNVEGLAKITEQIYIRSDLAAKAEEEGLVGKIQEEVPALEKAIEKQLSLMGPQHADFIEFH
nr:hypothetical protein [Candidatus Sigynarchaeum springense]